MGNFELTAPVTGAIDIARQPTLSWQPASNAVSYSLLVASTPDFTNPVVNELALTENSFTVTNLLEESGTYYWCVIANNAGGSTQCTLDYSFTTEVLAPPVITDEPRSLNVAMDESCVIEVSATGLQPMSYQWQKLVDTVWTDITDAISPTYTTPALGVADDGASFRCVVTNDHGEATSNTALMSLQRVLRVKVGGSGDGSSWAEAIGDLQTALTANLSSIDEVWVAAGTYKPGVLQSNSFTLVANVGLYGGFAGSETVREDRDYETSTTTLSGDIGTVGNSLDNSTHVVRGVTGGIIDGFTISNGNADGPDIYEMMGGGMYNSSASPAVRNCRFVNNTAEEQGGGMHNSSSSPAIDNCIFEGNDARMGGGLGNNYYSHSVVSNCKFTSNAANDGGGMHNIESNPVITGCTFYGNLGTLGGGLCNEDSNPTVSNCNFDGNGAFENGGGIYFMGSSNGSGTVYLNYSCVAGWTGGGSGNISQDPLFVSPLDRDGVDDIMGTADDGLRLRSTSPCIDAANGSVAPALDILGNARLDVPSVGTGVGTPAYVDIGAYEYGY